MLRRGLARSRSEARRLIDQGRVAVEGRSRLKAAAHVDAATRIEVDGPTPLVGRAGDKLDAALERFKIEVTGRRALDVGAATGGFTDCLLRRGAVTVVAVDVGTGQFSTDLAARSGVRSFEGLDFRQVDPVTIGAPFDLIVVDVSFISVCALASQLNVVATKGGDLVVLVKPQFEVGRERVGRGVVTDPKLHEEAVNDVRQCLTAAGLSVIEVMASPVKGRHGNQEFFLWARKFGSS
jgi:23S rRNA (cytidine1920-2'-O)/16S rRNA (cytidine1409-2'-O)-methyltransferase